ncbi:MAG: type II toxin-antitoxin system ParD family antitoxin [Thermoanaerobaculia bacterium]|nr:type II toxin-antitoxin system ParD family antitoxin [Thermoanaerobaculia bacterium]
MATMNISLPASLRNFVEEQVDEHAFSSASEYVRQLIRQEWDRERLRKMILEGANSEREGAWDSEFFENARERLRRHASS